MEFTKAHGTGNDFVVLDDRGDDLALAAPLVRALCDRRTGVGADGVLRIGGPTPTADLTMDYRNADGSVVELCGNGIRVVAKYAVDHGIVAAPDGRVVIATRAGDRAAVVARGDDGRVGEVTVDMGPPVWDPVVVGIDAPGDAIVEQPFDAGGTTVALTAVSMGNPHAVIAVEAVADAPVATLGARIGTHARFRRGANVEFVEVVDRDALRLRIWERGVGETAACGTGACAAAVVMARLGRCGDDVTVWTPGGPLQVRYRPTEHPSVMLTGAAVEVASGSLAPAWLDAIREAVH